jgi:hypothetical protein
MGPHHRTIASKAVRLSLRQWRTDQSPGGEIGRHSGLKIRRFVSSGRTGSIPVPGTINEFNDLQVIEYFCI